MLNTTDWIIISIALLAAVAALLMLRPHANRRDQDAIRTLRSDAEKDHKQIVKLLETLHESARDADYLAAQLKERVYTINKEDQRRIARYEHSERLLDKVYESERELRSASTSLGERLEQIQHYWDGQLDDTVDSIKQIRERLKEGLLHVDDGINRLHDQEKMAQSFTRKLIEHYQEQAEGQKYNAELSGKLRAQLEDILDESQNSLSKIREHQGSADAIFQNFADEMVSMEVQASEHFTELYQSTDIARQEMTAGLTEARHHLETLRQREEQSHQISQRIRQQAGKVESLNIEQLTKTISSTNKLCGELQENVTHARDALSIFDETMVEVKHSLQHAEAVNQGATEDGELDDSVEMLAEPAPQPTKQLFALRSYQ